MGEAGSRTDSASAPGRGRYTESWQRFTLADASILIACIALGLTVAGPFRLATWQLDAGQPLDYLAFGTVHGMLIAVPAILALQYLYRGRCGELGTGELVGVVTSAWWLAIDLLLLVERILAPTGPGAAILFQLLVQPLIGCMILIQVHAGFVVLAVMAGRLLSPRRRKKRAWSEYFGLCVGLAATAQAGVILLGLLDRELIRLL